MKQLFQRGYLATIYTLLYLPIFVLVLNSFNQSRFSMQWHGFSMQWYHQLFQDSELWIACFHSLLLGVSASFLACALSLIACLHFFLNQKLNKKPMYRLLLILIILPDLVLGIALLIFFNFTQIPLGFTSLLVAHITFSIPFTYITISSRMHHLDVNLYFSALDLGASRQKAFIKVLLPILWPAIFSAFLLGFTLSFDDVIISYFIAGPEYNILPLTIYSLVRNGVSPELNALCSVTLLFSIFLVIIAHQLSKKST